MTGLKKGDPIFESGSLDGPMFVKLLLTKVIPAIRKKMKKAKVVYLQFDNAPGHMTGNLADSVLKACRKGSPMIVIVEQVSCAEPLHEHMRPRILPQCRLAPAKATVVQSD